MDTIVKSVVTAAVAIGIAWPLLFWSQIESSDSHQFSRPAVLTSSFAGAVARLGDDATDLLLAR